jgi:hypothetical protein
MKNIIYKPENNIIEMRRTIVFVVEKEAALLSVLHEVALKTCETLLSAANVDS